MIAYIAPRATNPARESTSNARLCVARSPPARALPATAWVDG